MSAQVLDRAAAREAAPDGLSGILASRRQSRVNRRLALAFVGLIAAAGAAWYSWDWWRVGRFVETTDDAYVGGNVTTLSPHVAGFVARILVGDNELVHAGQLLVELDDRDYQAGLAHAEAVVRHQTRRSPICMRNTRCSNRRFARPRPIYSAKRPRPVSPTRTRCAITRWRCRASARCRTTRGRLPPTSKAAATVRAGAAAIDAARQQLAVLDTEIAETKASLAQAEADLKTARLDLGYTEIRSPIDGYIGDRAAQIGAYATVGDALLSIVPAHGLWVDANFKEDELARMRPGQRATIVADVLPGHSFTGRVLSLAPATGAVFSVIPPQNATGNFTKIVQRVPVRIAVADGEGTLGLLRPGLSTTVSVDTRPAAEHRQ